jgi:hypothetical protein
MDCARLPPDCFPIFSSPKQKGARSSRSKSSGTLRTGLRLCKKSSERPSWNQVLKTYPLAYLANFKVLKPRLFIMVCTIKEAARSSKNDEDLMFVAIICQWNVGRTWNRLAVELYSGNTAGDAAGIFHPYFVASRMVSKINGIVWP